MLDINRQISEKTIKHYELVIRLLIYIIVEIQLNMVYAILVLNKFYSNLNKTYKIVAKYILCYLKSTLYIEITYRENN